MGLILKETDSHRIQVELDEIGIIDGREFVSSFTGLGMTIKPTEIKVKVGSNFRIIMEAKKSYDPNDFFLEHQEFLDNFVKGPLCEN